MNSFLCALLTTVRDRSLFTSDPTVGVMLWDFWPYSSSIVILGNYKLTSIKTDCFWSSFWPRRYFNGVSTIRRWMLDCRSLVSDPSPNDADLITYSLDWSRRLLLTRQQRFCRQRIVRIDSRLVSTLVHFQCFKISLFFPGIPVFIKVSRWCAWTYWAMLLNLLTMPKSEVNAKFWSGHVRKSSLNSWKLWWAMVSFSLYQLW